MKSEMLPNLQSQPKPEPKRVRDFLSDSWGITINAFQWLEESHEAHSDSELSIGDFEIPANSLVLKQIPIPIIAMHIFNYLSSVIINPNRPCWPWSSMSRNKKGEFRWRTRNYTLQNGPLYYLHKTADKTTGQNRKYLK